MGREGGDEEVPLFIDELPVLAAVVRAEETALLRLDEGVDPPGIRGRDVDRDLPGNALGECLALDLLPRVTAVAGAENAAGVSPGDQAPGTAPRFPQAREEDAWIRGIDRDVGPPRALVDVEDFFPALSSVLPAI